MTKLFQHQTVGPSDLTISILVRGEAHNVVLYLARGHLTDQRLLLVVVVGLVVGLAVDVLVGADSPGLLIVRAAPRGGKVGAGQQYRTAGVVQWRPVQHHRGVRNSTGLTGRGPSW